MVGNRYLAVGPSGADHFLVIDGQVQEQQGEVSDLGLQEVQGSLYLKAGGRVQDVVGGGSQVDPLAGFGADLGHGLYHGHHVVAYLILIRLALSGLATSDAAAMSAAAPLGMRPTALR